MHQRGDLVPASINLTEYDKDGAAWAAINRILAALNGLSQALVDANIVIGADRLDAALTFYNYLGFIERTGVSGAAAIHADLKSSYPGRRTHRPPATPPPGTP